jgi:hypothetical protein
MNQTRVPQSQIDYTLNLTFNETKGNHDDDLDGDDEGRETKSI